LPKYLNNKFVSSKCPLRLGLAGGGTDVDPYRKIYGGHCITASISLYAHCKVSSNNDNKIIFNFLDKNLISEFGIDDNLEYHDDFFLVKSVYLFVTNKFNKGKRVPLCIYSYVDVPSGSGVGSSSSLVVAVLGALLFYFDVKISKRKIASYAFYIERELCGYSGGRQDQYAAVYGGFNSFEFMPDNSVKLQKLKLNKVFENNLNEKLLLFYVGASRESSTIIVQQARNIINADKASLKATHKLKKISYQALEFINKEKIDNLFALLNKTWVHKKKLADLISNQVIDNIVLIAQKNNAKFVKVSGAGGGGFVIIGVDERFRYNVITALKETNRGDFFHFIFEKNGLQVW
jgi:D-glycero-alpha-D-manno-heptose-7-phosphate kinase